MKHRIKIRQHILVPAIVEHEVEFDTEKGTCEYVADGSVVSYQDTLSIEDLYHATPDKKKDTGTDEIACKALLDSGVLSPKPGEPVTIHGRQIPYDPEAWADEELIVPHPRREPFPEPVSVWRYKPLTSPKKSAAPKSPTRYPSRRNQEEKP